ncbi:MAG: transposase [cyanobacterium endosymbiont of Rhopalodia yunnanensis]
MRENLVKLIKTISLRKCLAIEIINDQLKNLSKIEHFRYQTV